MGGIVSGAARGAPPDSGSITGFMGQVQSRVFVLLGSRARRRERRG